MNALEIIQTIESHRDRIRSFGVKSLILFGSFAADTANEESDIDLLVEFIPGRGLFDDFIHLHHFLESLLGKEVDLGEEFFLKEEIRESVRKGKKIEAKL